MAPEAVSVHVQPGGRNAPQIGVRHQLQPQLQLPLPLQFQKTTASTQSFRITKSTSKSNKGQAKTSTMADSGTRESNMKAALKAIEEGRMTYSQAHETYGIGVGTLNGRKKGAKPRREAHRTEQKLSPALEDSIVHWILFERRNNRPPTKGLVRQYAQHICDVSGIPTKIGHNWVDRFISRHPEVLDSNNSGAKLRWRKGRPLQSDRRPTTARNEASVENCGEAAGGLMTVAREEHAPES